MWDFALQHLCLHAPGGDTICQKTFEIPLLDELSSAEHPLPRLSAESVAKG